jgi:hypothetical protein
MPKKLMLAAILLLSAAWLQAQQYPQAGSSPSSASPSSSQSDSSQSGSASSQTVEGCLQGSDGNFTLTDKSGMTYQLAGDTSKLTEHVGHEVQIKGSTSGAGGAAGATAGAAAGGEQTLTVESVKHVSKTCKSASK